MENLESSLSADKKTLTVKIRGRFDFKLQKLFRQAYEGVEPTPQEYVIDFKDVLYIDSSGLGMLMVFHQHVHQPEVKIRLTHTKEEVKELLQLANLSQLFEIH